MRQVMICNGFVIANEQWLNQIDIEIHIRFFFVEMTSFISCFIISHFNEEKSQYAWMKSQTIPFHLYCQSSEMSIRNKNDVLNGIVLFSRNVSC